MHDINLPVISIDHGLSRYLREINAFPMLEENEERELAKRLREHSDLQAAHRLVTSHLRLVAKIAMHFKGYGLPIMDIIAEGNIGLMRAVKKFEPNMGYRLATYAMWWIKASIQDYILKSWSIVKIGTSSLQKRLFFNLRKIKNKLRQIHENDADTRALLAKELKINERKVDAIENGLSRELSLHDCAYGNDSDIELGDTIPDTSASQEDVVIAKLDHAGHIAKLHSAINVLNEREQYILRRRRLSEAPYTLEMLSEECGVSRERIRQIEENAISKLRAFMLPAA